MPEMPNELLEIAGNELRPIVRDDSWLRLPVLLLCSLQDHFDVSFPHRVRIYERNLLEARMIITPYTDRNRKNVQAVVSHPCKNTRMGTLNRGNPSETKGGPPASSPCFIIISS